jgi:hypothetical protein|tara:strand:- start:1250 stop:2362 length:1113 start_codon:yes stop_codon:yes gene_type:complete
MSSNHADRGHAEFSPSSLKYCAGCAGFNGREGTNSAAEMGTRIHEAIEILDPSNLQSEEEVSLYQEIVADQEEYLKNYSGHELTEDFAEIVLDIELIGTSTFGTCDSLHIFDGSIGVLADYKTGISKIDTPKENYQAKAYTVGCFQKYPELERIDFVFFIPQRNEILSDTFKKEDLVGLIEDLSNVIIKAETVRPKWEAGTPSLEELTPTVNCRFCRYEDVCPALGGLVVEVAKKVNPQLPDVDIDSTEDPEVIEQLWAIAKIVTNWADKFKKRAVELAKEGKEYPNLQLKSMGSTRKITDNRSLLQVAELFGMSATDIIDNINIPLSKVAKSIGDSADKGGKKKLSNDFIDACEQAGIVEKSPPRHTLS